MMTLNEYQEKAMTTCMDSCNNFSYMILNLVGEVGEFSSKVAKFIRKREAVVDYNVLITERGNGFVSEQDIADLRKEAGDCLWQLVGLCKVMGWSLEEVAQENLDKLASRQQRGKIDGNGDNR